MTITLHSLKGCMRSAVHLFLSSEDTLNSSLQPHLKKQHSLQHTAAVAAHRQESAGAQTVQLGALSHQQQQE
eukprot:5541047-Amphidinium_carterae.2